MKNDLIITIPTASIQSLNALVTKLNRKAEKLGLQKVVIKKFTMARMVEKTVTVDGRSSKYWVEVTDVTLEDVKTSLDGYILIGKTENIDGISILNNFSEGAVDLTKERGTCKCDHCKVNRNRNKVYFLAEENNLNDYIRVGSTCVDDFFPKTAGSALSKLSFVEEVFVKLSSFEEDEMGEGFGGHHYYGVGDILNHTCMNARKYGYTSNKKAEETGKVSTKNDVLVSLGGNNSDEITEQDIEKAEKILNWFNTQTQDSEYFDNCRQIVAKEYCQFKLVGYIVGLYGAYNYFKQKSEDGAGKSSNHIGQIGSRKTFTGVVKSVKFFETMYGQGALTTVDCDGEIVVYFNTLNTKMYSCEEGDSVEFDAKIKEHGEFNGVAQTVVSRATKVKVLERA